MENRITIELYNAVIEDQPCSWVCPICKHRIFLRKGDGVGIIHFNELLNLGIIDSTVRSNGTVLYSVSIRCPNCNQFIVYVGEYSDCEKIEYLNSFDDISPDYKQNIESVIFNDCIYPLSAISDIKYFTHVPERLQTDYKEMSKLISISPAAATVFGRRCIERLIITRWPKVRDLRKNGLIPHLSEMIAWLKKHHPEVIESNSMNAIKTIGDKAIHIFDSDTDIEITQQDALLLKDTIEELFSTYFEEEQKKHERRKAIAQRAFEISDSAKKIENSRNLNIADDEN